MISTLKGIVTKIILSNEGITIAEVKIEKNTFDSDQKTLAINYDDMIGPVQIGDIVIINNTAKILNLGTGGYDFIVSNLSNNNFFNIKDGHIMKLRYTPLQINVLSIEEQTSKYHSFFDKFKSLNNFPVIIGELHSMVAPTALVLKQLCPNIKITYIMTDSASLPIKFSNTVNQLKKEKIISNTITIGNAFGGDYEAVNIYTALIAAKEAIESDIAIVAMGPGIVGTGTKYGFSGIDQANIIDAVNKLGGKAILIPRISFNDKRERHLGLSHHTKTVLELANSPCILCFPQMGKEKTEYIKKQISSIESKNEIFFIDSSVTEKSIKNFNFKITTMGRDYNKEKEFFDACGAAAIYCCTNFYNFSP